MTVSRDTSTIHEAVDGGYNLTLSCDYSKGCSAKFSFFMPTGEKPEPLKSMLDRERWQETRGRSTRYFCPKHRIVSPQEQHRAKLDRFLADRVALDEYETQVPTTRVWDEFVRYVGRETLDDPGFSIGKRELYAAVRALGRVWDDQRNLTVSGKQTCTPTFRGISLKTTAGPEDHDEWIAKRKGGVLAKKREIKAAELDKHRNRAELRRAAARQDPTAAEHVARFVAEHLAPAEGSVLSSDQMYTVFGRYLAANDVLRQVATKREFMALLAGQGLKTRRTSHRREGRQRPISITVYDGVAVVKADDLSSTAPEPRSAIFCTVPTCRETAQTATAGDLGWIKNGDEHYCLGHAVDRGADLVADAWPSREDDYLLRRTPKNPGPRGYEIAESDIILDEDVDPAAALEAAIKAFEAEPEDGPRLNPDEYDFD